MGITSVPGGVAGSFWAADVRIAPAHEMNRVRTLLGVLADGASDASFARTVAGARFIARLGANPVITAAAVHRCWFTAQLAARISVPGASDAFVTDVQTALQEAPHVQDRP